MGLDLSPRDYLEMLTEEYREYQEQWHANHYRVSMRKAINCCGLSNAMPEIIFAHYSGTDPEKVHRAKSAGAYRKHLRKQCEAHHIVRDICDYSKHGPNLDKRSKDQPVSVHDSELIVRQEGFSVGALLVLTQSREVERLEVRHKNGRTELLDEVLKQVIASWNAIFDEDKL
jgi:hypothetical protein